ncbi:hypothetical protein [Chryseobacterium gambrini]|uniref:hypothetical protein n=1 Tax=Chryseobacterium gambrini TaxID=373672 RepID=UPI0022F389DA|nr:hypothetical protein [Chryseobacterium gambrini]WBX99489.1 hypothetical protein PE065_09610 [Chryseobacterium gambrini]
MNNRNQILNPIFIVCLMTLLLNDFYLKQTFSNALTGKISDFAGLTVFPIFIAYVFPNTRKWISIATGILFMIWKTPLVTPIIETLNQFSPLKIQRIIDYSDYWALVVLPIAHTIINRDKILILDFGKLLKLGKIGIASVSLFAICATSTPPPVEMPKGTIYIGKEYTIKKSKAETIEMIKSLGYNVDFYNNLEISTSFRKHRSRNIPYYQTNNIIIYDENSKPIDTILNVKYTLYETEQNRTKIEIINVKLSEDGNIQRWQTLKYLRKQYKKSMEKQVIEKLK